MLSMERTKNPPFNLSIYPELKNANGGKKSGARWQNIEKQSPHIFPSETLASVLKMK